MFLRDGNEASEPAEEPTKSVFQNGALFTHPERLLKRCKGSVAARIGGLSGLAWLGATMKLPETGSRSRLTTVTRKNKLRRNRLAM